MEKGLVIKSTGSWYRVKADTGVYYDCKIKGKFRMKGIRSTNPIAVGDWVDFKVEASKDDERQGVITKIHDRKNYIVRKSSNLSKYNQIIASNVDQAFLIVTINYPKTLLSFIDRFLVSAEAYDIKVNLIFNKHDLYNEEDIEMLQEYLYIYSSIGYECFVVSAKEGLNIDRLQKSMSGKINVFSGNSGVGKSTLINVIEPGLNLRTGEISESHQQGKHTTTFAEMFQMSNGGYLVDTPGIRGFGVIDIEKDEVSHFFPEIFEISDACSFNNCTHTHEPGCAVKDAVEEGEISLSRYESYLSLLEGDEGKYR